MEGVHKHRSDKEILLLGGNSDQALFWDLCICQRISQSDGPNDTSGTVQWPASSNQICISIYSVSN